MQKVKAAVKKNENDAPTIGYYNVSDIKVIKTKKQKHKANTNDNNNSTKANNNNDMLDMPLD
jgi:predicted ATP-binding protein involved in virulence